MHETSSPDSLTGGSHRGLVLWADRRILWLSKHWLAALNIFMLLFVGLPFLAPILLAAGYSGPANFIYSLYRMTCHQLPSRSYFIFGQQVAFCQRDVAIYGSMLLGGLVFGLVRHRLHPLPVGWYILFLVPIALDGGMQLASIWLEVGIPINLLWAIGLIALGIAMTILRYLRYLSWHSYLFFAFGPLALLYLQYVGPHTSNWLLRTITGFIFAFGTVWFTYPYLETAFADIHRQLNLKLHSTGPQV
jgi:uncharacterized membrane protein